MQRINNCIMSYFIDLRPSCWETLDIIQERKQYRGEKQTLKSPRKYMGEYRSDEDEAIAIKNAFINSFDKPRQKNSSSSKYEVSSPYRSISYNSKIYQLDDKGNPIGRAYHEDESGNIKKISKSVINNEITKRIGTELMHLFPGVKSSCTMSGYLRYTVLNIELGVKSNVKTFSNTDVEKITTALTSDTSSNLIAKNLQRLDKFIKKHVDGEQYEYFTNEDTDGKIQYAQYLRDSELEPESDEYYKLSTIINSVENSVYASSNNSKVRSIIERKIKRGYMTKEQGDEFLNADLPTKLELIKKYNNEERKTPVYNINYTPESAQEFLNADEEGKVRIATEWIRVTKPTHPISAAALWYITGSEKAKQYLDDAFKHHNKEEVKDVLDEIDDARDEGDDTGLSFKDILKDINKKLHYTAAEIPTNARATDETMERNARSYDDEDIDAEEDWSEDFDEDEDPSQYTKEQKTREEQSQNPYDNILNKYRKYNTSSEQKRKSKLFDDDFSMFDNLDEEDFSAFDNVE